MNRKYKTNEIYFNNDEITVEHYYYGKYEVEIESQSIDYKDILAELIENGYVDEMTDEEFENLSNEEIRDIIDNHYDEAKKYIQWWIDRYVEENFE